MSRRLIACLPLAILFAACGPPEIVVNEPLTAVNWSPHDGASGIDVDWEPSVCLSLPIDAASLNHVSLREGEASAGEVPDTQVAADVQLSSADARCIVFRQPALQPDRLYHMVLGPQLRTTDGTALEQRLSSRFRTSAD